MPRQFESEPIYNQHLRDGGAPTRQRPRAHVKRFEHQDTISAVTDPLEIKLLGLLQAEAPVVERPFAALAERVRAGASGRR